MVAPKARVIATTTASEPARPAVANRTSGSGPPRKRIMHGDREEADDRRDLLARADEAEEALALPEVEEPAREPPVAEGDAG